MSNGGGFCGAIKTDGTLWTWGQNELGQLGQGTRGGFAYYVSSPVQVGALTNWARMSASNNSFAAIKTDGTLWTWGDNDDGQLGLGDSAGFNRSAPAQVGSLTNWSKISSGSTFCTAIKTDGSLWTWGSNNFGQLGRNNTIKLSSPVQLGSLTWSEVSGGDRACAAIQTNGTLWAWGRNIYNGQLGQNDQINRSSPVQIGSLTTWSKVHMGNSFCTAIKTDGSLWAWGQNNYGQLGNNSVIYRSSPVQVGSLTTWSQTSAGQSCAAIKTDGTLWTWGYNGSGQLGQNNTTNLSSPVQVGSLTTWRKLSFGNRSISAISN
jgi:alpha-tubulin suppressor-like RCC1 family protein